MNKVKKFIYCIFISLILSAAQCNEKKEIVLSDSENNNRENTQEVAMKRSGYEVINTYNHDNKAFTQGLIYNQNFLYEGTGLYGESSLRKVNIETREVLQIYELPDQYFGEGSTI